MGTPTTFVKLDRSITKWRWYQDANTARLFIHLILTANIEEHDFERITVQRGQRVASRASLARELGMTQKQIRTAIGHLLETGEVAKRSYPKYTVFSVVNYDQYQAVRPSKRPSEGPAEGQQRASKGPQSKNLRTTYVEEGKNNIGGVAPEGAPAEPEDGDYVLWRTY